MYRKTTIQENQANPLRFYRLLRESSKAQRDKYGLPTQRRVTEAFSTSLGGIVTEENTATVIESAGEWVRGDWQNAVSEGLRRCRLGQANAFLLPRVDRETRNLFASIPRLKEVLDAGIPVYFAEEGICLTPHDPDAVQKYLEAAMEAAAYLRRLVKNTQPGRIARAKDGAKHPTNTRMFSFVLVDGKRVPNQAEAAALREAAHLALQKGGPGPAARWLNEQGFRTVHGNKFSTPTLSGLFRNRALIGETTINFREETVVVRHEPILDFATFEALQAMLDGRRLRAPRSDVFYALSGLIFCGCGARVEPSRSGNFRYYRCKGRCGERAWRKDELECELNTAFSRYLEYRESHRQYLEMAQQSRAKLERDLAQIERDIEQMKGAWTTLLRKELADYPEIILNEEKRKLRADWESLHRAKARIGADLEALPQIDPAEVELALDELRKPWEIVNVGGYHIPYPMSWERQKPGGPRKLSEEQAHMLRETLLRLNCRVTLKSRAVFISGKLQLGLGAKQGSSGSTFTIGNLKL